MEDLLRQKIQELKNTLINLEGEMERLHAVFKETKKTYEITQGQLLILTSLLPEVQE